MVTLIPWLSFGGALARARSAGHGRPAPQGGSSRSAKAGLAGEKPLAILMSHWRAAAEEARLCLTPRGREIRWALPGRPSR